MENQLSDFIAKEAAEAKEATQYRSLHEMRKSRIYNRALSRKGSQRNPYHNEINTSEYEKSKVKSLMTPHQHSKSEATSKAEIPTKKISQNKLSPLSQNKKKMDFKDIK